MNINLMCFPAGLALFIGVAIVIAAAGWLSSAAGDEYYRSNDYYKD